MKQLKALALAVVVCVICHVPPKDLYLCPAGVVDWDDNTSSPPPHCN